MVLYDNCRWGTHEGFTLLAMCFCCMLGIVCCCGDGCVGILFCTHTSQKHNIWYHSSNTIMLATTWLRRCRGLTDGWCSTGQLLRWQHAISIAGVCLTGCMTSKHHCTHAQCSMTHQPGGQARTAASAHHRSSRRACGDCSAHQHHSGQQHAQATPILDRCSTPDCRRCVYCV